MKRREAGNLEAGSDAEVMMMRGAAYRFPPYGLLSVLS